MLDGGTTLYGYWDLTIPEISERSRLCHLDPIELGTPNVESLVSYATRLAEIHDVSLRNLIETELVTQRKRSFDGISEKSIAALLGDELRNRNKADTYSNVSRWLDNGKGAAEMVKALETVTLQQNLDTLTMLPWKGIIPSMNLFRWKQAWCPACYQEWHETHKPLYEPLLWALQVVEMCPRHRQRLVSNCPYCMKAQAAIQGRLRLGYCSNCGNWLGLTPNLPRRSKLVDKELDWQLWVIEMVSELLVVAPQLTSLNRKIRCRIPILRYVDNLAEPEKRKFAQLLHTRNKLSLKKIQAELHSLLRKKPPLTWLLKFCHCAGISLLDLLTEEIAPQVNVNK